ncbi:GlxA family transcriptional regulator [Shimia abyssi]|uniref:AraC family transcriptional regulator with amidase-like domain n=1 Tax=Shimia abyssi TaxID=1662395 RepID=A0A2P8FAH7_9RHOB|nr:GlxA family transcriptional regulator [Shimia abyssi]PSL18725.1 AraC family transcriptional regulator with amidase-like domain [Shimia abyssi]
MIKSETFAFLLVPEFTHIAFSCAIEPLRIANLISGRTLYSWVLASSDGTRAVCSNGTVTLVDMDYRSLPHCDRVFALSGINVHNHLEPDLLACLRQQRARGAKIGALCSGAFLLAKGGMLDNMRAAIHWDFHDGFMEDFPEVNLVSSVFVADEPIVTASGGTATADLMLHLIEETHGADLAIAVADQMVYNAVREGTAEQRVSLQSRHGMRNPHLVKAIQIMGDSIEAPKSPSRIAEEIGISTRQLERLFGRHLNCSPKKYLMDLRLQRARNLLVQTDQSVTEVALACGFESPGHFARVYRSKFGITPTAQQAKLS